MSGKDYIDAGIMMMIAATVIYAGILIVLGRIKKKF